MSQLVTLRTLSSSVDFEPSEEMKWIEKIIEFFSKK